MIEDQKHTFGSDSKEMKSFLDMEYRERPFTEGNFDPLQPDSSIPNDLGKKIYEELKLNLKHLVNKFNFLRN